VERLRAKGRWMNVELSERDKDTEKQERIERIKESRYNKEYERCMTEEISNPKARKSNNKHNFQFMNYSAIEWYIYGTAARSNVSDSFI
jgi:hypothetical protein